MLPDAQELATLLKETRRAKKMSQRELGVLTDLPQSHISRIESGAVDVLLSNFIMIARALDLELAVVPRKMLPAVKSMAGTKWQHRVPSAESWPLERIAESNWNRSVAAPAYVLDADDDNDA